MKSKKQFTKKNHYIPQFYLKQWTNKQNQIFVYKFLVSHYKVPEWTKQNIKNTACNTHLYTLTDGENLTDSLENWLNKNIETPVIPVIKKINKISDLNRLSKQENRILFKFLAAQYFRTPLGIYNLNKQLVSKSPKLIYEASKDIQNINISELKEKNYKDKKTFPLKIKPFKNKDKIYLYLETFIGKSAPLLVMQNILEYIYEILIKHNWKILNPPKNKFWITSDNPALFINFNSILDFNYNGGWNSINTNIIFPVSPNKLLFTQVGKPIINIPNPCSRKLYNILTLLICHGSYKEIYSSNDLIDISMYRNRVIDKKAFERENKYWNNTHKLLNIEKDYFKNKY